MKSLLKLKVIERKVVRKQYLINSRQPCFNMYAFSTAVWFILGLNMTYYNLKYDYRISSWQYWVIYIIGIIAFTVSFYYLKRYFKS